jgi:hypothetical protein
MLDLIPTALMAFAALAWLRVGTSRDASDDLELLMGCLMLNAAALALWNGLHGPQLMLSFWAPQAAAAGIFSATVQAFRYFMRAPIAIRRTVWPSGAFALAAIAIALVMPAVEAGDRQMPGTVRPSLFGGEDAKPPVR